MNEATAGEQHSPSIFDEEQSGVMKPQVVAAHRSPDGETIVHPLDPPDRRMTEERLPSTEELQQSFGAAVQDIFGRWLDDECDVEPGNKWKTATSADLFKAWSDYARRAGESPGTQIGFAKELKQRELEPHKGTGGVRMFRGIQLKPALTILGEENVLVDPKQPAVDDLDPPLVVLQRMQIENGREQVRNYELVAAGMRDDIARLSAAIDLANATAANAAAVLEQALAELGTSRDALKRTAAELDSARHDNQSLRERIRLRDGVLEKIAKERDELKAAANSGDIDGVLLNRLESLREAFKAAIDAI